MGLISNFDIAVELPHPPRNRVLEKSFGARARPGSIDQPDVKRVAVLIVHGMGQQVPYETISQLTQSVLTQHQANHPGRLPPNVTVNLIKLTQSAEDAPLMRAECELTDKNDQGQVIKRRLVHVYEGYWSPLTEGEITFFEVIGRLYRAGWDGIRSRLQRKTFSRWMFNGARPMTIKTGTLTLLCLTLLALTLLLPLLLVAFASVEQLWTWTKQFILTAPSWWPLGPTSKWWQGLAALSILAAVGALTWLKNIVIQYVGDVIIYVSSQDLNRWYELRGKIQDTVLKTAKQLYSAGKVDPSHLPYDEIVIAGHSLGSVVAYDTLNALLNWDEVEMNHARDVQNRTQHLITFGSPLDKTAFLFRTQVKEAYPIREAMAARKQPLILDYMRYRPKDEFEWVNIYSAADVISGKLEYYDDETSPGYNGIRNEVDPHANIPLVAHVQYWQNELLHKELYKAIF